METSEPKSHASVISQGGTPAQEQDNLRLQQMGNNPVQGLISNFISETSAFSQFFRFSCTLLGTWKGLLRTFIRPLENGGSGGTVHAFVFALVGTAAIFVVLSELTSMHVNRAPTAGGQHHWAVMLPLIKYQSCWAVLGWQTALASCAFMTGTMLQDAAILGNSLYIHYLGNTVLLVVDILRFSGIPIPLACLSDHKPREEVFLQFLNSGGFSTQGLSWFVGISCAFGFAGGDAAVHMSEEVANPSCVIPHAIMLSVILNGCLGFGMLIAVLFCVGNLEDALNSRTGGVPGWPDGHFSKVSLSQALPVQSVILTVVVSSMLALINIGSFVALDNILSMAVSALYLSYLMFSILLCYRRINGDISQYVDSDDDVINMPGAKLAW
ncbi:hypothetical protein BDV41DRAFT_565000 [Aspergillus transmontanensis]|uniref:Uncharacterized protein n=1 Tax=Aspergillus transmontanensis TaxID=1034304 RepID=A0A5N6VWK4_9EURO|nr:hypothetical protein BDV41DRAFT_565000 [Aspergillus transmontanensis]